MNAAFLDCDSCLFPGSFNSSEARSKETGNKWEGSLLQKLLNKDNHFYGNREYFTEAEELAVVKTQIASTMVKIATNGGYISDYERRRLSNKRTIEDYYTGDYFTVPVDFNWFFCLDAADTYDENYGYLRHSGYGNSGSAYSRGKSTFDGRRYGDWWLRNPFFNDNNANDHTKAGIIGLTNSYGKSTTLGREVSNQYYVSPACNIDLDKVLFSSVVKGEKGKADAEYKFTMVDDNIEFVPLHMYRIDNTMYVPYSVRGSLSANATNLSLLVLDGEYKPEKKDELRIKEYQHISQEEGTLQNGIVTFDIPSKASKNDGVYIIAEDINEGNLTDYASPPVKIEIPEPDTTAAVLAGDIARPVAEFPFDREAAVYSIGGDSSEDPTATVEWKDGDGNIVSENAVAELNKSYYLTVNLNGNFQNDTAVYFQNCDGQSYIRGPEGEDVTHIDISRVSQGWITISCDAVTPIKRRIVSVSGPNVDNIPGLTEDGMFIENLNLTDADKVKEALKNANLKATAVKEGVSPIQSNNNPVEIPIGLDHWEVFHYEDGEPKEGYNPESNGLNYFRWTLHSDDYSHYETDISMTGVVSIRNHGAKIKTVKITDYTEPIIDEELDTKVRVDGVEADDDVDYPPTLISFENPDDQEVGIEWYASDEGYGSRELEAGTVAEYNYEYYPTILLKANSEKKYLFDEECQVYVNGYFLDERSSLAYEDQLWIFPDYHSFPTEKVLEVELGAVEEPVGGTALPAGLPAATPYDGCLSTGDRVDLSWTDPDGNEAYEAGWNRDYTVSASVSLNRGYEFTEDTVVKVDGKKLPKKSVSLNRAGMYDSILKVELGSFRTETEKIREIRFSGFEKPVAGEELKRSLSVSVPNGDPGIGPSVSLDWFDALDGSSAETAGWNRDYRAEATVSINSGYEFTEDTVVEVDGKRLPKKSVSIEKVGMYDSLLKVELGSFGTETGKISEIRLSGLEKPVAGEALKRSLSVSVPDGDPMLNPSVSLNWVDVLDGSAAETAGWNRDYRAEATVSLNSGYEFAQETAVTLDGEVLPDDSVNIISDGEYASLLELDLGTYNSEKRTISTITAPDHPAVFENTYTADTVLLSDELGKSAWLNFEGDKEPLTMSCNVIWSLAGNAYDDSDGAANSFYWHIDEGQLKHYIYDVESISTDGYVSIVNRSSSEEESPVTPPAPSVLPDSDVSSNRVSISENVLGDIYEINYEKTVSGNGKKHAVAGMNADGTLYKAKNSKSKQYDIGLKVYRNGEFVEPSKYKIVTKNNKKASVSSDGVTHLRGDKLPYFIIKFKGKEYKEVKKSFKDRKYSFDITPALLTKETVAFGQKKSASDGSVVFKRVTYTSPDSGKVIKLKYNKDLEKTDYVTRQDPETGKILLIGMNDYYGTVAGD